MAINPRPVPSDLDVQDLTSFLIKIAHVLAILDPSEIAGVLQITWDLNELQVTATERDDILRPVYGPSGVLLGRAYAVIHDTYGWHDIHHQAAIELVWVGDEVAND